MKDQIKQISDLKEQRNAAIGIALIFIIFIGVYGTTRDNQIQELRTDMCITQYANEEAVFSEHDGACKIPIIKETIIINTLSYEYKPLKKIEITVRG